MKLFHFYRHEDQSGVSGTGPVVEGVEFTNGWCALRWISEKSSICFYRSLEDVKAIHGHGGRTELIIHDLAPLRNQNTTEAQGFESLLQLVEEATHLMTEVEDHPVASEAIHQQILRLHELLDRFERALS